MPKCSVRQKIKYEQDHLGYISYTDSNLDKRITVVTRLDDRYSPKFVGYCLATGATAELKIHKKKSPDNKTIKTVWSQLPLKNGDIIYLDACKKENKRRLNKETNKWESIPDEYEWWIEEYSMCNI